MKAPEAFHTVRLSLRAPQIEDATGIFESYAQDPEVSKYLSWKPHQDLSEAQVLIKRLQEQIRQELSFSYLIFLKEENIVLGSIEMRHIGPMLQLGYVLARPHWSKGYMTEAAQALFRWGQVQEKISRIEAFCDVENLASARVVEKIGMQREALLRRRQLAPNLGPEARDVFCYAYVK